LTADLVDFKTRKKALKPFDSFDNLVDGATICF